MQTPFFITGLPRTRSAWLANLFTTGASLCFHEPKAAATELLQRYPNVRVGVADSTLVFNAPALIDRYPEAPWLYVERDAKAARRSLMQFTKDTVRVLGRDVDTVFRAHAAAAEVVKKHPRTLVVPFADLNDRIEEVWSHCLPGVLFWRERYQILKDLQVEQRFAELYKERMV